MIELRWYDHSDNNIMPYAIEIQTPNGPGVFTLQYRAMQNTMELGIQQPIWGDWVDVPLAGVDFGDGHGLPLASARH